MSIESRFVRGRSMEQSRGKQLRIKNRNRQEKFGDLFVYCSSYDCNTNEEP